MLATTSATTTTAKAATPPFYNREQTAELIPFDALVASLKRTAIENLQGLISSPERIGVPLAGDGVSLSMPASAADISIHKLVNVQPANVARGIPTIQGVVTVCDAQTGLPLLFLDGPEVTGRRTAGISLLAIQIFLTTALKQALVIGTGTQAAYHVVGLRELHPGCEVLVRGLNRADEEAFCLKHGLGDSLRPCPPEIPASVQVVLTLTTSRVVVYDEPPMEGRLVIGVGAFKPDMAELGPRTLESTIFADDVGGAKHEAGDLLRAQVDWRRVRPLAEALTGDVPAGPIVVKSVGTAAWDLAAARVAMDVLKS